MRTLGIIVTCAGSIIVESISRKRKLRPRNWKRANPYATRMHEKSVPMVLIIAIRKLLRNNSVKVTASHAVTKFSIVGWNE